MTENKTRVTCDLEASIAFTELYNKVKTMFEERFKNKSNAETEMMICEYIKDLAEARYLSEMNAKLTLQQKGDKNGE